MVNLLLSVKQTITRATGGDGEWRSLHNFINKKRRKSNLHFFLRQNSHQTKKRSDDFEKKEA